MFEARRAFGGDNGVIRKTGKTEGLRDSVRKFIFKPKSESVTNTAKLSLTMPPIPGLLDVLHSADSVSVTVEDCDDEKRSQLQQLSANGVTETALNLDEIFEAYVIGNKGHMLAVG